jgi:hypothetical protein
MSTVLSLFHPQTQRRSPMLHKWLAVFLLATLLLIPTLDSAAAQVIPVPPVPIDPYCGPLDVVFVIDDTGSMGGALTSIQAQMTAIITTINNVSGGDYQLGLVTFKDNVTVLNDLAPGNAAAVTANINALVANGGWWAPEASDEALNTAINGLDAGGGRPQIGNFNGVWRTTARKMIILVTDAEPGGFDDNFTAGVDDVNAQSRANQAAAQNIQIAAVHVPGSGGATTTAIMQQYANITGGVYAPTDTGGSGAGVIIQRIIRDCPCAQPPVGMVAWYPFDTKLFVTNSFALDVSSSPVAHDIQGLHHGNKQNGPTFVAGKVQDAMSFNGINQFIDVPNTGDYGSGDLNFGAGAFSFDTWIRFPSGYAGIHPILHKHTSAGLLSGYHWFVKDGQMGLQMTVNGTAAVYFSGATIPNDGNWHFLAVTVNRSANGGRWYIDGNPVGTSFTPIAGNLDNAANMQIAKYTTIPTGEYYLRGALDELEIFERTLTAAEVQGIYRAGERGKCKNPCPALLALTRDRSVDSPVEADDAGVSAYALRALRDRVWNSSIAGRHYTGLYEFHSERITELLLKDADLRQATGAFLGTITPGVRSLFDSSADAAVIVDDAMIETATMLVKRLHEADLALEGGDLAKTIEIELERVPLHELAGLTFGEAWQRITEKFAEPNNGEEIVIPDSDLGDAPDSTNSVGVRMTAYPSVVANFPTTFADPAGIPGPIHWNPKRDAWLGRNVCGEKDADQLPDCSGVTNIDPAFDGANRDEFDDGVQLNTLTFPYCALTTFRYDVNIVVPGTQRFANVFIDFNRDGDWNDSVRCTDSTGVTRLASEWVVRNQAVPTTLAAGYRVRTTPSFRVPVAGPSPDRPMWMRITLSDQKAATIPGSTLADGRGPVNGFQHGETEDYLLTGILPSSANSVAAAEAVEGDTDAGVFDGSNDEVVTDESAEGEAQNNKAYLPLLNK